MRLQRFEIARQLVLVLHSLPVGRQQLNSKGEGSRTFRIRFRISLSNPTGEAVLGTRTIATILIRDTDPGLGLEVDRYDVWEGAGEVTLLPLQVH
jgi:hypothetical protein